MTDSLDKLHMLIEHEVVEAVDVIRSKPGEKSEYLVEIPETFYVDSHHEDIEALIARTANAFSRLSRLAGLLHALWKSYDLQKEHEYARAFRAARTAHLSEASEDTPTIARGRQLSVDDAEAVATIAAESFARKAAAYEGYFRIIDRHARAAEVASESARKLARGVEAMLRGEQAGAKGRLREADYQ